MLNKHQKFGNKGESIAARHLKKNGYRILEQNYRTSLGEIDIIAADRDTIVFVEVKARKSGRFGDPKWAVTLRKQRKISMVALHYLKATQQDQVKARFDVVSINASGDAPGIELVKNAFELAYT
jgi:putative endonuclease